MSRKLLFGCSLAIVYLVWGSSYLAMHWALQAFPPHLLAGLRGFTAGSAMLVVLWWRGVPLPTPIECRNATAAGMLLSLSSGMISVGIQSVPTSTAAILVATVPIFASLIAALCGIRVQWREWLGIAVGFVGIGLLNEQGAVTGINAGNLTILFGALCWALGSHLSARLRLPANIIMSSALQIMLGGAVMLAYAWWTGERVEGAISIGSWSGFVYLCLFGSLLGYCAYNYLVRHGSAAIANSYAYVSPVVAVLLGAILLSEKVTPQTLLAMSIIIAAVALVFWSHYRRPR